MSLAASWYRSPEQLREYGTITENRPLQKLRRMQRAIYNEESWDHEHILWTALWSVNALSGNPATPA
jgi:hypothetical protein